VLRHPWHGKGHADLTLCTRAGIIERSVTRSAGAGWRLARKLEWGSGVQQEADLGPAHEG
jgi:ribosomal protein RSM22 (predicted rRNA methylase)